MPYIPFTDEQKVLANSVDLEQFLRMRGEKLERVGREHKLIYCDSERAKADRELTTLFAVQSSKSPTPVRIAAIAESPAAPI